MFNVLKMIACRISFIAIGVCVMGFWIICVLMRASLTRATLSFPQNEYLGVFEQQNCHAVSKRNLLLLPFQYAVHEQHDCPLYSVKQFVLLLNCSPNKMVPTSSPFQEKRFRFSMLV